MLGEPFDKNTIWRVQSPNTCYLLKRRAIREHSRRATPTACSSEVRKRRATKKTHERCPLLHDPQVPLVIDQEGEDEAVGEVRPEI